MEAVSLFQNKKSNGLYTLSCLLITTDTYTRSLIYTYSRNERTSHPRLRIHWTISVQALPLWHFICTKVKSTKVAYTQNAYKCVQTLVKPLPAEIACSNTWSSKSGIGSTVSYNTTFNHCSRFSGSKNIELTIFFTCMMCAQAKKNSHITMW